MKLPNLRNVKTLEVIAVESYEGEGTQESPGRLVTSYFDSAGRFLADDDPLRVAQKP